MQLQNIFVDLLNEHKKLFEGNPKELMLDMFQSIRVPPLPLLKLRRENDAKFCETWTQNKLAEILTRDPNHDSEFLNSIFCMYELKDSNTMRSFM